MRFGPRFFDFDGLLARVECSEPEDLEWLTEFLQPQFGVRRAGSHACSVRLAADLREWKELYESGPDGRRKRECYFLDTRIVRLPVWRSGGRETVLFDGESDVFCVVNAGHGHVRLLKQPRKRLARLTLMRVVREYALNHVARNGGTLIHAGAFVLGSNGVLIAGKKGCGKTSLLLHALRAACASYVSNDRVLVDREDDGFRMRGIPTIINLRVSTLRMFPELYQRLRSSAYNPVLSLQEADHGGLGQARPWRKNQYTLSPKQLCRLLEVKPKPEARLAALLFPRVTNREGPIRLEALSGRRAASSVLDSLFRSGFARQSGSLFSTVGKGHVMTDAERKRFASALAARVPCYACHVGANAYRDPSWPDGLSQWLDDIAKP